MPLTDSDTKAVVALVLVELSKRRQRRIVTAMAVLSAMASIPVYVLTQVWETTENQGVTIEELRQRPYVAGLATDFHQADRLVIVGTAFGLDAGSVELFYKVNTDVEELMGEESTGETRTQTLYLSGESIEQWTDDQIIVSTTEHERQSLLDRVGKRDFENMIPYIRVVRADGARSSVW